MVPTPAYAAVPCDCAFGSRHQDDEDAEPSGSGDSSGWETEEGEEMDVESAVAKARAAAEAITANSGTAAAKPSSKAKVRDMQHVVSRVVCHNMLHGAVGESCVNFSTGILASVC
jgi:hypothetical protein